METPTVSRNANSMVFADDDDDYTIRPVALPPARSRNSNIEADDSRDKVSTSEKQVREERIKTIQGTPQKGSGSAPKSAGPLIMDDAKDQIAQETLHRRWRSKDLVNQIFNDAVSLPLVAHILLAFLIHGVISVTDNQTKQIVSSELWVNICADACYRLKRTYEKGKSNENDNALNEPNQPDPYTWQWDSKLQTGSEEESVKFLNVVGLLALIFARAVDSEFNEKHQSPMQLFNTMLDKHRKFPLPSTGADRRPDIISLPCSAYQFDEKSEYPDEKIVGIVPPLQIVKDFFPSAIPDSAPDHRYTPEAIPRNLVELSNREALIHKLKKLFHQLKVENVKLDGLSKDLRNMLDFKFLNTSWACWCGLCFTGECKESVFTRNGYLQLLVYMQEQWVSQPHLRFVLGISVTSTEMGLMRSDAAGVERHAFDLRTTTGVLETIRLVLSLIIANDKQLGVNPVFELEEVVDTVDSQPAKHSKTKQGADAQSSGSPSVGVKRKQPESEDNGDSREPKRPALGAPVKLHGAVYRYRKAIFVKLPDGKRHSSSKAVSSFTRYYLHYLTDNRGSLTGRLTRVWCAYKEVPRDSKDIPPVHLDAIPEDIKTVFLGPYALKFQYIDTSSQAYKEDIAKEVKVSEKESMGKYLLLPDLTWRGDNVLADLRGFRSKDQLPTDKLRNQIVERQEVITQSLFKRKLSQYKNIAEVIRAIADVYRAIGWLNTKKYLHRDISDGNILLEDESASTFTEPKKHSWIGRINDDSNSIWLVPRKRSDRQGVYGLLHDMDMAGNAPVEAKPTSDTNTEGTVPATVNPINDMDMAGTVPATANPTSDMDTEGTVSATANPPNDMDMAGTVPAAANPPNVLASQQRNVARFRTGTLPYMSIDVLRGKKPAHTCRDDMESIFYVFYLFLFTYGRPAPETYPDLPTLKEEKWPEFVNMWAYGLDRRSLGDRKSGFFMDDNGEWMVKMKDHAVLFQNIKGTKRQAVELVLKVLHDDIIWEPFRREPDHDPQWVFRRDTTPELAYNTLDKLFAELPSLFQV